jgi:hypothetical protein
MGAGFSALMRSSTVVDMVLDVARWLPDNVLAKADRATMLASLERRTPFVERERCGVLRDRSSP